MKKLLLTLAFWLCWGFALGTLLLLGPVRKTVDFARSHDWQESNENMTVFFFIGILAFVSFFLARYTAKKVHAADVKRNTKAIHIAIPVIAAITALFVLMTPSLINADSGVQTDLSTQFTIGPYPVEDKMQQLNDRGYTALVSLLHPAVVPFEPKLLNEEREMARKYDLDVISIPMLPWISDNTASIDSFRSFVRNAKGKYYIHCYLGKDRVNVARRIIEQEAASSLKMEQGLSHRSIDDVKSFERGTIYKLAEQTYLSPMPTKEEYTGYVIAADFKRIVALSPSDQDALTFNKAEEAMLRPYQIPYKAFYLPNNPSDQRMMEVIDSIKQLPKPVFIHCFRTSDTLARQFKRLYK